MAIHLRDVYEDIVPKWTNELVVCSAGAAAGEWFRQTDGGDAFYLQASIGLSSMFGLGLAMGVPETRTWVFEGDGALSMNPGALFTLAEQAPANLTYFVLANGVYGSTGSQRIPNAGLTDFVALAKASGIEDAVKIDRIEQLQEESDRLLCTDGLKFVEIDMVAEEMEKVEIDLDGAELKYRFGRHIERTFDRSVFNSRGY